MVITMAIAVALGIVVLGVALAIHFTRGTSKKRKYIVWGIALMVAIAPFLSFAIGLLYAIIMRNGWAALIMWYLFPILFLIGVIMLIVGIFIKK